MQLPRLLDLACAIQQIPAPTFQESQRAAFVREQFAALSLQDITVDELGNVYGRWPGAEAAARPLVVSAHTDTVFPLDVPLTLTRTPDRITGPGIGDNSVAVAGLMGLVWELAANPVPGDVWLVANVCEEGLGDLLGMKRVVERFGAQPRAYIVLEGMALEGVYHVGIGVRRYRFTVRTPGGHSWHHFGRSSAIHTLIRLAAQITQFAVPTLPKTTFNIGTIAGGTSVNTIAREATFDLDLRSEDPAQLELLVQQVEQLKTNFKDAEATLELSVIGNRPAGGLPPTHPLVQLAVRALRDLNLKPTLEAGSTDANIPLSQGLPCICLGLTTGSHSHRPDEYIDTAPLALGMQALVQTVRGAFAIEG